MPIVLKKYALDCRGGKIFAFFTRPIDFALIVARIGIWGSE